MSQQKKTELPISDDQPLSNIPQLPMSIKLERLPILTGRDDYRTWAGSWEIAFDSMGLLEILIEDAPSGFSKNSAECKTWNLGNKQVRGALLGAVDESLRTIIIDHQTAKEAWEHLKSRFDRETSSSTISLLKAITSLSLKEGDDIPEFLTIFNDAWNRLRNRSSSKSSLAKAFRDLTFSGDVKGAFLMSSLPESMDNVIDNLVTKEMVSYEDASAKLLDISASKNSTNFSEKAYFADRAPFKGKGKQKRKEKNSNARGVRSTAVITKGMFTAIAKNYAIINSKNPIKIIFKKTAFNPNLM